MVSPVARFSSVSLKVWMGIAIALMAIAVWLCLTLLHVAPQVTVLPQLFSPDTMRFHQFVEATNLNAVDQVKEKALIDEMLVRFYVENRNIYVPDKREMSYRIGVRGPIARLSTYAVYQKFMEGKEELVERISDDNQTTKSADITSVIRRDNTFSVDFDTYVQSKGLVRKEGSYRATVKIRYFPKNRRFHTDLTNPFGMAVISYDETVLKKTTSK